MKKLLTVIVMACMLFSLLPKEASAAAYDKATTFKKVKVYQKAGTSYKVLYTIPKGQAVKVIGGEAYGWDQENLISAEQFGFYKVTYKNKKGYIKQGNLKFKNPYNWAPGIKKEAIKYAKDYADGNSYYFKKSHVWNKDGYYEVYGKMSGTWYRIGSFNCKTGWAHG